jgi:DHA1 family tetracycline resistance protein-like MFS transporter
MRKPSLLVIFLTVFIDLVGFGIVLPLLPKYVKDFGAPGWMVGAIVASYSLMQFVFAPAWGRLSDRIGRRPVLLVSTAGFVVSYGLFAIGSGLTDPRWALGTILASRILSGVCGANITVAQAYIADLTPPQERSKKMGLIGMAFGLGFIFGPALAMGAVLLFGDSGPGWVASGVCLLNLALAWARLGESLRPEHLQSERTEGRFAHWREVLSRPSIGTLVVVYFLSTFAFSCFETTLGLLVAERFHFAKGGPDALIAIAFLFAFCGLIGAFIQGGPIGRLVRSCGEVRLIALSLVLVAISLAPLPFLGGTPKASLSALWRDEGTSLLGFVGALFTVGGSSWVLLLVTLSVLSIGSGLTRPPLFGLVSMLTPANEQGSTLGITQGAGSLARIAGPVFATSTYAWHATLPYTTCALLALAGAALTLMRVESPVGIRSDEVPPVG